MMGIREEIRGAISIEHGAAGRQYEGGAWVADHQGEFENRNFTLNGWNRVNAAILNAVSESASGAVPWDESPRSLSTREIMIHMSVLTLNLQKRFRLLLLVIFDYFRRLWIA